MKSSIKNEGALITKVILNLLDSLFLLLFKGSLVIPFHVLRSEAGGERGTDFYLLLTSLGIFNVLVL